MLLSEIFEQLEEGELRQMALGGSEASGIIESDYPKIIPHVNLGLSEIYKRFPLRTEHLTIQQYAQITNYQLLPKYAQSNTASTEPVKYIMDSSFKPFTDDAKVLKIEAVFDEEGQKYHLNDETNPYSVYTPTYNTIQIPFNDENNAFGVTYRAGHPKLSATVSDVLNQEVEISDTHLRALLLFIGARYLKTRGNAESTQEGIAMLQEFYVEVGDVRDLGLDTDEHTTNLKLEYNGWA
jgi:hypothetical protein